MSVAKRAGAPAMIALVATGSACSDQAAHMKAYPTSFSSALAGEVGGEYGAEYADDYVGVYAEEHGSLCSVADSRLQCKAIVFRYIGEQNGIVSSLRLVLRGCEPGVQHFEEVAHVEQSDLDSTIDRLRVLTSMQEDRVPDHDAFETRSYPSGTYRATLYSFKEGQEQVLETGILMGRQICRSFAELRDSVESPKAKALFRQHRRIQCQPSKQFDLENLE